MRKFTTIFVTVVLCLAALAVCASAAANTNCAKDIHDWSAWAAIEILEDGSIVMGRSCSCGEQDEPYVIPAPHTHELTYTAAVEGCHTYGVAEYWYCAGCDTHFSDAEAKYPVAYLSLATEPTVELGFVPATEACHKPGSKAYWQCPTCDQVFADLEGTPDAIPTTRKDLAIAPDCELAYVPAAEACHVPGTAEYWYCPDCEAVYADAEGTVLTNRKNLATEPVCELAYVPAAEACHVAGTAEYWYCVKCEAVYADAEGTQLTNRKNLAIEPVCELAHVPAAEACHVAGSAEYWYCVKCEAVYADAAGTQLTNRKNLATEAVIELVHHEAIAPCHANGYLEYWYCPKCDNYFADAAATQQTNIKNLTVEGDLSKLAYTAKVEATATENGMNEYWYCAGCDCFFTDAEGKYNIAYLSLTIPATGEVVAPDTGDNAIFFIVALVAVATLGVAAVSFKKREN